MLSVTNKHDEHNVETVWPQTIYGALKFCSDCKEYYGKAYDYDTGN